MTRIKLCGLSRAEDIEAANALHPDFVGFVFAPNSRRAVTSKQAAKLKAKLDPSICTVGVFTDQPAEDIAKTANSIELDAIQLHGTPDEAVLKTLSKLSDACLIQAFQIHNAQDIANASQSCADLVLLDAGAGCGSVFDWTLLKNIKRPYILAGGLSPENVGQALELYGPWGVDVSSGIETNGKKDPAKMAAFCQQVRKEKA